MPQGKPLREPEAVKKSRETRATVSDQVDIHERCYSWSVSTFDIPSALDAPKQLVEFVIWQTILLWTRDFLDWRAEILLKRVFIGQKPGLDGMHRETYCHTVDRSKPRRDFLLVALDIGVAV